MTFSEVNLDLFEHNYDSQRHSLPKTEPVADSTDTSAPRPVKTPPAAPPNQGSTLSSASLTATAASQTGVGAMEKEKSSDIAFDDGELVVQWYISPLDGLNQNNMMLVYAMCKKMWGAKPREKDEPFELWFNSFSLKIFSSSNTFDNF